MFLLLQVKKTKKKKYEVKKLTETETNRAKKVIEILSADLIR